MKSILKIPFIILLIIIPMSFVATAAEEDLNAKPAIWSIEQDQSKVYFLGSVHLLPDDVKWYGGTLKEIVE